MNDDSWTLISDDGWTLMNDDGWTLMNDDGWTLTCDDGWTLMSDDGWAHMNDDGWTLMHDDGWTLMHDDGWKLMNDDCWKLMNDEVMNRGQLYAGHTIITDQCSHLHHICCYCLLNVLSWRHHDVSVTSATLRVNSPLHHFSAPVSFCTHVEWKGSQSHRLNISKSAIRMETLLSHGFQWHPQTWWVCCVEASGSQIERSMIQLFSGSQVVNTWISESHTEKLCGDCQNVNCKAYMLLLRVLSMWIRKV
jgi:hypothetical protein